MTRDEATSIFRKINPECEDFAEAIETFVALGMLKLDERSNALGETIGKRISNARRLRGLTQEQLAEKMFVSPQAVSGWERDEALPETSRLVSLVDVLGTSLDSLLRNHIKPV